MVKRQGGSLLEDVVIVGGLLVAQCVLAGYAVFIDHLLSLGAHPLAIIAVGGATSAAFFLPLAVALERKRWPPKVSGTLLAQLVLIALGG
jgi:drug/metabolite transporter (DMT)-like permease